MSLNVLEVQHVTRKNTKKVISPAARGTKKLVYLPYRGAIPFWFYLVPLRLVSIFSKYIFNFRKNNLHHQKARKKLNIRHLNGYLHFSNS